MCTFTLKPTKLCFKLLKNKVLSNLVKFKIIFTTIRTSTTTPTTTTDRSRPSRRRRQRRRPKFFRNFRPRKLRQDQQLRPTSRRWSKPQRHREERCHLSQNLRQVEEDYSVPIGLFTIVGSVAKCGGFYLTPTQMNLGMFIKLSKWPSLLSF